MAKKQPEKKRTQDALKKEVADLGRRVEDAIQSAAKNEKLRAISSELAEGVRRVGSKLVDAVEAARESDQGKAVQAQLKKVLKVGKEKGGEAAEQARASLASGLKVLGQELSKLAERMEK